MVDAMHHFSLIQNVLNQIIFEIGSTTYDRAVVSVPCKNELAATHESNYVLYVRVRTIMVKHKYVCNTFSSSKQNEAL